MAGWLENSFGDFAKPVYIKRKRSEHCSVQLTNTSDDEDCVITYVSNQASTLDLPSDETNRSSGRETNQSKQDEFGAKNVSTQVKSQHNRTAKDRFREIEIISTLPPVKSKHPTQKNNEQDKPPNIAKQHSTCLKSNEGFQNHAVRQANTKTLLRFPAPRNWEKLKTRNLGSLTQIDRDVSVFAVVSYFHSPKKTSGAHMFVHFGLVDPTLYGKKETLPCICFQQSEADMPLIKSTGDIIKFPLRMTIYQNKLQGKTYEDQFPWMTFDGQPNAPVVPRYSRGSQPTFTDADKKKVEELKSWAASVGITQSVSSTSTLAELTGRENSYFNLLCQVVHFDGEKMLYVWDGTQPSFPGLLSYCSERFASATRWGNKVIGKCVKVWIYGIHAKSNYATGQYIEITNLHFILKQDAARNESTQIPILSLHDGTLHDRGIKILDDDDVDIQKVTSRMEALPTPPVSKPCDFYNTKIIPPTKRKRMSNDAKTAPSKNQESNTSDKPSNQTMAKLTSEQVNTKTLLRFPTPRNWETLKTRNLDSLTKTDKDVSVFAVVSYFHSPKKTGDAHMFVRFGLVDPTLYVNKETLPCICFQQSEADMPLIKSTGDVIKLPLRMTIYQNKLQGKTYEDQFPWMTFDGQPNALVVPRYSRGSQPTFTDDDKKKVEELKSWAASVGITQFSLLRFYSC